ncbi:hypothetical protein [Chromobacterium violaceum]|uniref:hypothetical protein n=2 Tax=Chromobacterium violaceum TaxID=536 RepID=UPI00111C73B5|nr:hypothetical protein [Chromobacterium violaceum]
MEKCKIIFLMTLLFCMVACSRNEQAVPIYKDTRAVNSGARVYFDISSEGLQDERNYLSCISSQKEDARYFDVKNGLDIHGAIQKVEGGGGSQYFSNLVIYYVLNGDIQYLRSGKLLEVLPEKGMLSCRIVTSSFWGRVQLSEEMKVPVRDIRIAYIK